MNVLGNVSYNLCNVSNSESNICPLKPGSQVNISFIVPGSIISNQSITEAVYLGRGTIKGDNNNVLGCLKVLFQLESPKHNILILSNQTKIKNNTKILDNIG